MAVDGALHRKLVTIDPLTDELDKAKGRHGARRAAAVIAFADGRRESVGESRSRVALRCAGLPEPDLQVEIRDEFGASAACSDFGYVKLRVAGEFDGLVKYGRLVRAGETPGDAVVVRSSAKTPSGMRAGSWSGGSGPS